MSYNAEYHTSKNHIAPNAHSNTAKNLESTSDSYIYFHL